MKARTKTGKDEWADPVTYNWVYKSLMYNMPVLLNTCIVDTYLYLKITLQCNNIINHFIVVFQYLQGIFKTREIFRDITNNMCFFLLN